MDGGPQNASLTLELTHVQLNRQARPSSVFVDVTHRTVQQDGQRGAVCFHVRRRLLVVSLGVLPCRRRREVSTYGGVTSLYFIISPLASLDNLRRK